MRDEENTNGEEPTLEYVELLRERRESDLDRPPFWHLLGFRLLPLALLCFLWAAIDTRLFPFDEVVVDATKLGTYLLTAVGVYLIHEHFHVPRYGESPWPDSTWNQLWSLPKDLLTIVGLATVPAAGFAFDFIFGLPFSFTLAAVWMILLLWWWVAGTKGRLFRVEERLELVTMSLPPLLKIWEFVRRHYCLVLAGIVFLVSLTPLIGLADSKLFANVVALELIAGVIVTVISFFDELRLRRLTVGGRTTR